MMPGARLRSWAVKWLDAGTVERLVDPVLADLQSEYQNAIAHGHTWRARVVLIVSYVAFWKALALNALLPSNGSDEPAVVRKTMAVSFVAFVLTTILFVLPPILQGARWPGDSGDRLAMIVLLVPQALPLSLPIGLCVGVLYGMRGRRPTRRHVLSVLAIACVGVVFALISVQWLVPAANQAFREAVAAALSPGQTVHLEPGLSELGLSRLGARADAAARRQFQALLAVCVAPLSFGLIALALSAFVRRAAVAVALAIAVPLAYWQVMFMTGEQRPVTWSAIVVAPWVPNLVFLAISLALLRLARSRA
jgi:lipopolysaccharide export LptBFGC system permease protein LptF